MYLKNFWGVYNLENYNNNNSLDTETPTVKKKTVRKNKDTNETYQQDRGLND